MISIKINEKDEYIDNNVKCKNYSVLEGISLLDIAIDILKNDFEMKTCDVLDLLKEYKTNMKEVSK